MNEQTKSRSAAALGQAPRLRIVERIDDLSLAVHEDGASRCGRGLCNEWSGRQAHRGSNNDAEGGTRANHGTRVDGTMDRRAKLPIVITPVIPDGSTEVAVGQAERSAAHPCSSSATVSPPVKGPDRTGAR